MSVPRRCWCCATTCFAAAPTSPASARRSTASTSPAPSWSGRGARRRRRRGCPTTRWRPRGRGPLALRAEAEAQRRTRDAYAGQFELGLRDLLDVLDAENQLFNARVALTTAEFTEQFAVYRSLAVVGALLDAVEVTRPRETGSRHRPPDDASPPAAGGARS